MTRTFVFMGVVAAACLSCKSVAGRTPARGSEGELPPNPPATTAEPAAFAGLGGVVAGNNRTCAIKQDGSVFCWGRNSSGQLGFWSTPTCSHDPCLLVPGAVPFLTDVVQVALSVGSMANVEESCARSRSGATTCWSSMPDPRMLAPGETPRPPRRVQLTDVVDVAVGGEHACAVKKDGHVWCWGRNGAGQLGFVTTPACTIFTGESRYNVHCSPEPGAIPDLDGVAALALGQNHSCARKTDGTVVCWGDNGYGELGDGTTIDHRSPKPVLGLADVAEISAGERHTCARKKDGTVWCWGIGEEGQLGLAGEGCTNKALPGWPRPCLRTPQAVPGINGAVEVRAGRRHTCVRRGDGAIWCWGDNSDGPMGPLPRTKDVRPALVGTFPDAVELSTGAKHTCVRRGNGTATCWGANAFGQLGDGTQIARARPAEVLATARRPGRLRDVAEIRASGGQTCARTTAGAVYCWGANSVSGPTTNIATEVAPLAKADAIAVGNYHACARHPGGAVSCWGENGSNQLAAPIGKFSAAPVAAAPLPDVAALAADGDQTCARTQAGKVVCWGNVNARNLGFSKAHSYGPMEIPGVTDVAQVAVGGSHACALRNDGTVVCWGANHYGQVGPPFGGEAKPPAALPGLSGVTAIVAGGQHSCALQKDGVVMCWGSDPYGELGYPSTTRCWTGDVCNATPAPVRDLPPVVEIAAGRGYTCARTQSRAVYCWGSNQDGALGDGTRERRAKPERVAHLADVAALTAGAAHACARKLDGTAWCWGSNYQGQLGDGSTSNRYFPWPVLR